MKEEYDKLNYSAFKISIINGFLASNIIIIISCF